VGHFVFAKLMGVKVEKFSIGFGPPLLSRKYGETEYMLSAVPLGGYVKMLGENPEEETEGEEHEELSEEDMKRSFSRQPIWKRFVIVFMGPMFNLLFAALVFFVIFLNGVPELLPEIGGVKEGTPAYAGPAACAELPRRQGHRDSRNERPRLIEV